MDETRILSSIDEVKALSDPYRFRILNCLNDIGQPATVKQIADKLGEVPAKVHYHIKKLESYDIVRLHHTEEVKGIIAKFYLPTAKHFEIKCTEGQGEFAENLMLGETQRMIGKIYEDSKDIFLEQLQKKAASQGNDKAKGTITANDVYLSEDQALELEKYIEDFFEKHKLEDRSKGQKKYHCFFSIIKTE
jgi:predicted ArsR family transcriptional regulator